MKAEIFAQRIKDLGIDSLIGVPDSTLKQFCDYINTDGSDVFHHYVPANEGAAVGLAAGIYLASGKPACVYMQNSGIGNAVNPMASLMNERVYKIPALYLAGWRGEPHIKDEPQHVYQGMITKELLELLDVEIAVLDSSMSDVQLDVLFARIKTALDQEQQFALVIRKDAFDLRSNHSYKNSYSMLREDAIAHILKKIDRSAMLVSTTGKISREVYEQSDLLFGSHEQLFLTVGSMGHASMIALGLAKERADKQVYCIDGDGAALMHMGSMAFLAKQNPGNLTHIVLNNDAHESVGGMPTGATGVNLAAIAKACGYPAVYTVSALSELDEALEKTSGSNQLTFLEVKVNLQSRENLGRPKESAENNKLSFMNYHEGK